MEAAAFQKKHKNMEAATVRTWSELPGELLVEIAARVLSASFDDFRVFRKVCKSWRAATTKDLAVAKFSEPWPVVPYMMLPEKEGSYKREFYSLIHNKVYMTLFLPEAQSKMCIEVKFGWLLTLAYSGEAKLLNPLSRSRIDLPNLISFLENRDPKRSQDGIRATVRAALSENPSRSSDFVLAVVTTMHSLVFWKNGDEDWTMVRLKGFDYPMYVNYHNQDQKFYVIGLLGHVFVLDPNASNSVAEKIMEVDTALWHLRCTCTYMVESSAGELLLVARNGTDALHSKQGCTYGTTEFRVFRVDVGRKKYQEIQSLEDEAVFVGHNAAFSIPASKHHGVIKPNSIYFSDDCNRAYYVSNDVCGKLCYNREDCKKSESLRMLEADLSNRWGSRSGNLDAAKGFGRNMGVYDLEDGSIQRFDQSVERLSFTCPSLWISLSSLFS